MTDFMNMLIILSHDRFHEHFNYTVKSNMNILITGLVDKRVYNSCFAFHEHFSDGNLLNTRENIVVCISFSYRLWI